MTEISRCPSCDGYGWVDGDWGSDDPQDCDWCAGIGYVYILPSGAHQPIPPADYGKVAYQLEALDHQRMREIGYTGEAKPPWEQAIRNRSQFTDTNSEDAG